MDQRQREFALAQVSAEGLAYGLLGTDEVEHVIDDLKRHAQVNAELVQGGAAEAGGRFFAQDCAELAACPAEAGGLAANDFEVGAFVQVEVVAIGQLQQLAFADGVGRQRDEPGCRCGSDDRAEVIGMADEIVAEHDGCLVALKLVDRHTTATDASFVEDVIVDERRHVHHLDDGGDGALVVVDRDAISAGGHAADNDEHRPKHLAAIAFDVSDQRIDAGEIAEEFDAESALQLIPQQFLQMVLVLFLKQPRVYLLQNPELTEALMQF